MNRSALDSPSLGEHSDNLKHVDRMRKKFSKPTERPFEHFLCTQFQNGLHYIGKEIKVFRLAWIHPSTSLRLFCSRHHTTMNRRALDSPGLGEHSNNLKHVDRMHKKFSKPTERPFEHILCIQFHNGVELC